MSTPGDRAGAHGDLTLTAIPGIAEILPGDDLFEVIRGAMAKAGIELADFDVLAVSHKIVSKAEGRGRALAAVRVSAEAASLAELTGKDPRLVQAILDESSAVLRHRPGLVIARHRSGMVMANAGIDQSNIGPAEAGEQVLRLPADADASAERLRGAFASRCGVRIGVVICDSVGRAWRRGVVGQAIGAAGLPALVDRRGERDRQGRELRVTYTGFADQIASAAELVMGEAAEGRPVVVVRGLSWSAGASPARDVIRPTDEDLFC